MSEQEKISNIIMSNFSAFGIRVANASAIAKEILGAITAETLRDKFAGQALAGLHAATPFDSAYMAADDIAERAYRYADSMLAERDRLKGL